MGGGGAHLKKGDQIFNVVMIRCASSEDTQGSVQPTDCLKWGQLLLLRENVCQRRRRELLRGS